MHAWTATAFVIVIVVVLHSELFSCQLAGIPLLAPGTWHGRRQRHYQRLRTQHAALQLSRKPLRALPPRRTLPEGSRVTNRQRAPALSARPTASSACFIYFIFNFVSFFFFHLFIYVFFFAAAACFSALFFLVMAPFLHDFVIYMHTHARADTYTLTHTHTHTRTCSALFLCPIHVPRMFDMHLLRAWPASLHSSCRPLFLPPPLSLPLFLGCPAAWQLIWQMRKLPENATSLPT